MEPGANVCVPRAGGRKGSLLVLGASSLVVGDRNRRCGCPPRPCLVAWLKQLPRLLSSSLPFAGRLQLLPRRTASTFSSNFFWPHNKDFKALQTTPWEHTEECFILMTVLVPSGLRAPQVRLPLRTASSYGFRSLVDSEQLIPYPKQGKLTAAVSSIPPALTDSSFK